MNAELKHRLHERLLSRGYALENSREDTEAFGSWYRDYARGDRRVRLIWDGRDEWFVLQGGNDWHDLALRRPGELAVTGLDEFLGHAD